MDRPLTQELVFTYYFREGECHKYEIKDERFFIILESEWGVDDQWLFGIPLSRNPKRSIDPFNDKARNFIDSITIGRYNMSGVWQYGLMRWQILLRTPKEAEELLRHFASGGLKVRGRGDRHHTGAENNLINTVQTALETYRNGGKVELLGKEF